MRKVLSALIAGLILIVPLCLAPPAGALQALIRPAASCNGDGCYGLDPVQTGCDRGAFKAASNYFTDSSGQTHWISLIYSPTCHANWALIQPGVQGWQFFVKNWKQEVVYETVQYNAGDWWGNMVDGTGWAQACYLNNVCTRRV
jgi:hypothetical protein